MAEYPYSPELKKPLAAGDVDFLDPKTQKTLETVMKIFQFQAKIVIAPSGVRKSRQEYPAENGDRLPYLLSAPKNNTRKLQVQVGHPAVEKTGSILATVLVEASDSTKIGASAAA